MARFEELTAALVAKREEAMRRNAELRQFLEEVLEAVSNEVEAGQGVLHSPNEVVVREGTAAAEVNLIFPDSSGLPTRQPFTVRVFRGQESSRPYGIQVSSGSPRFVKDALDGCDAFFDALMPN